MCAAILVSASFPIGKKWPPQGLQSPSGRYLEPQNRIKEPSGPLESSREQQETELLSAPGLPGRLSL